MRVKIECECEILQRSLELFLKEYIDDDFELVISDVYRECKKPLFLISHESQYIDIPFSKEQLLEALDSFYCKEVVKPSRDAQEEIEALFDEFKDRVMAILKERQNG